MPPKRKATVKGPFFFFMLEFREREKARGKSFPGGMDQVMREAGPSWNSLSDAERDVYKRRAKDYKLTPKQNYGEKYTSQGIPFSQIEKEHQARFKKQETIKKAIAEMIQTAVYNNALEKMKVHFISFNYFCKTTAEVYVPAEMAVMRYSLELGVLEKLHEFIDPVKLPLGMAYEANLMSEDTHQLPIPPNAFGENDFAVLLGKLLRFIDYENKDSKVFLFFTDGKEVSAVENILSQFTDESKAQYNFLVCPLGEFFYQLKRATESYGLDIRTFPAKTVADILLKKDSYEYTSGIACEFHEKLGNPRFCALSRITRWSFIISDNCCLDLSIDLIPGRHLPVNADTTLCSDLSETGSKSFQSLADRMSFVSSSDVTHISLPKIQKIRPKSPFRGIADETGSVIYSSRSGTAKDEIKKFERSAVDTMTSTNPFHTSDLKETVMPMDSTTVRAVARSYNPFSRQMKLEEVRQPRAIGVVGHGRGSLLGLAGISEAVRTGPSAIFRGTGRGTSLLSAASTITTASSVLFSDVEDE